MLGLKKIVLPNETQVREGVVPPGETAVATRPRRPRTRKKKSWAPLYTRRMWRRAVFIFGLIHGLIHRLCGPRPMRRGVQVV